jgi:hypothetical protein
MDMRFGTWKVRSLCRASSLAILSKELSKYKLLGVHEVRWEGDGNVDQQENTHSSREEEMRTKNQVQVSF